MNPIESLVLKATLVLAGALVASLVLRRRSAATRHLAWSWTLRSLVLLPLLALALPSWRVTLPSRAEVAVASGPSPALTRAHASTSSPLASSSVISPASVVSREAAAPSPPRIDWILATWLGACVMLLARTVVGALAVRRIVRRARPLASDAWSVDAASAARSLGLRREPRILVSDDVTSPGIAEGALLLPHDASSWSEERRRAVLLHELAHVARRDGLDVLLTRIAVALWWFHPLAWIAERRCRIERERACDDAVLRAGGEARRYVKDLLDLALPPPSRLAAIPAMARRSGLEERVGAILDARTPRGTVRLGVARIAIALVAVAALATLRVQAAATSDPLVLTIETGMKPDAKAMAAHLGSIAHVDGGAVEWERRLVDYAQLGWPGYLGPHPEGKLYGDFFTTFPSSVTLHLRLDRRGLLTVRARGPVPDVLCVLSDGGLTTTAPWGESLGPDRHLTQALLDLDSRATVLAFVAYGEMLSAAQAKAVSGGPELGTSRVNGVEQGQFLRDFDLLPMGLHQHLGKPVSIVQAALFVSQPSTKFAYGGAVDGRSFTEAPWWPIQAALNERWDPWHSPDTDGIRIARMSLAWPGVEHSFITARAHGDNGNSGHVRLDGKVVTQFASWADSSGVVRLSDARPASCEMALSANWSSSCVLVRVVALGGTIDAGLDEGQVLQITLPPE